MTNEYIWIPVEAMGNVVGVKPIGPQSKWTKKEEAKKKQQKEETKEVPNNVRNAGIGHSIIDIRV
ncbi:MAG: hypothetical protein HQK97_06195 [Nitrospirae bacterium]|nr:hypothetical protein [Nitrospirota bacterium]